MVVLVRELQVGTQVEARLVEVEAGWKLIGWEYLAVPSLGQGPNWPLGTQSPTLNLIGFSSLSLK